MIENKQRNPEFFFDTAEPDAIRAIWEKLESDFDPSSVFGVTTNPNALDKVGVHSLSALENQMSELTQLITEIKGGGEGVIYTQIPNSQMNGEEMQTWIDYIKTLGDGVTKIGVKLTPYKEGIVNQTGLEITKANRGKISTNITGIGDAQTAIHAFRSNPDYVSMIYGRIRRAGGDPRAHFSWAEHMRTQNQAQGRIIGGSMRDLDTLKGILETNAVPTIGIGAFENIFSEIDPQRFSGLWEDPLVTPPAIAPPTTEAQEQLTKQFFGQMDQLGSLMHADFKRNRDLQT